jgi:hypothetical protein
MDIIKFSFAHGGSRWNKSYPTLLNYEYNGTAQSEAFEKHTRMDPLLGVANDFDYPDYCVASLNHPLESYVLFVPSIRVGQIGEATTSNQEQHTNVFNSKDLSNEARAFAQSRYPFSPFILRFSTSHINEQKIADELCKFLKDNKQLELELSGYRKASTKSSTNECDLLIFVKNSRSFSILLNENNWPQSLLGLIYIRPSIPTILPQLSLIIKNVSLSIDF